MFGVAFTMGPKPNILPDDAFASKIIVAVIMRGGETWDYKVAGVTEDGDSLIIRYTATSKDGGGAEFASPLVVSVSRMSNKKVRFIENGKEVAKVDAPSGSVVPEAEPTTKTFTYKSMPGGTLEMVVHYPPGWKDTDQRPAIVFFFGGGWEFGNIQQFEPQADHLARRGMVAARADYRVKSRQGVTPEKCVEDAKSAVRWLRANAAKQGIDPQRIVAAGGSAGGHIAACTSLTDGLDAESEERSISWQPNALVLFNPVLRFDGVPDLMGRIGKDKTLGKELSPTLNVTKDTPPTLLFFGTSDFLFEQGQEFLLRAKEFGFRAEMFTARGEAHGFFNRPPWLQRTIGRMDEFLTSIGYLKPEKDVTGEQP